MPGGNRVGDNFDIIPGQGGEYQGGVEQKDGPSQQDSDQINIRASLTIYISIHFQHGIQLFLYRILRVSWVILSFRLKICPSHLSTVWMRKQVDVVSTSILISSVTNNWH